MGRLMGYLRERGIADKQELAVSLALPLPKMTPTATQEIGSVYDTVQMLEPVTASSWVGDTRRVQPSELTKAEYLQDATEAVLREHTSVEQWRTRRSQR